MMNYRKLFLLTFSFLIFGTLVHAQIDPDLKTQKKAKKTHLLKEGSVKSAQTIQQRKKSDVSTKENQNGIKQERKDRVIKQFKAQRARRKKLGSNKNAMPVVKSKKEVTKGPISKEKEVDQIRLRKRLMQKNPPKKQD